jgi:hypothetical protein
MIQPSAAQFKERPDSRCIWPWDRHVSVLARAALVIWENPYFDGKKKK